jgi:hypothetical protein
VASMKAGASRAVNITGRLAVFLGAILTVGADFVVHLSWRGEPPHLDATFALVGAWLPESLASPTRRQRNPLSASSDRDEDKAT